VPGDKNVKIEISDDEDVAGAWTLVEESTQNLDLPEVIPETCEDAVNDACTETSSSDVSENEDDRSGFDAQAAASSNLLLPQKVSQCGSTPSQRYCILVTAGHQRLRVWQKTGCLSHVGELATQMDSGICWKCFKHR